MLQDGEKGVVILRNTHTYAVCPHLPCGIVDPDTLRRIARVAENYGAESMKVDCDGQIRIFGIEFEDVDAVWSDLGMPANSPLPCVKPVQTCPFGVHCKEGMQDCTALALELDDKFHGLKMPARFEIAVSGCLNDCASGCIRDLSIIGMLAGWKIFVGGCGGSKPRLASFLTEGLKREHVLRLVSNVIEYAGKSAKKHQRLGYLIDQVGLDSFKDAVCNF